MSYTIGSLFDGSGGFPLAGAMCGFNTIWASEVEPYPIAVTKSRLPNMRHLGDISKINGANINPVDIITFGSPCQGLSVAGLQKGLGDERSALFMEAIRIIKEMREATNGKYPKWAIWENVPGAFSSNAGQDFKAVLEELIKIVEPNAIMPNVPKKGWAYADSYVGNEWSLAYRVLDSQYLRTAQRRRRIYLVLDLRGQRARKVLFERESLRGDFTESRAPWQGIAAKTKGSIGTDDRTYIIDNIGGQAEYGKESRVNGTLRSGNKGAIAYEWHNQDSRITGPIEVGCTLSTNAGGREGHLVIEPFCKSRRAKSSDDATTWKHAEVANTLNVFDQGEARANELVVYCLQGNGIDRADTAGCNGKGWREDECYTLNTIDRPAVVYAIDRASFNQGQNALYEPQIYEDGTNPTLVAKGPSAVCQELHASKASFFMRVSEGAADTLVATDYKDPQIVCYPEKNDKQYIVRRLTPTECARLQGFPDRWGDVEPKTEFTDEEYMFWLDVRNTHAEINGKKIKDYTKKQMLTWYNKLHTDSAEYKLWGNGIALPCALYVMQGIAEVYGDNYATQR